MDNLSSQQLAKPLLEAKHQSSHKNKDGKKTNPLGIRTEMNAAYSQHIHFSLGHFHFIGQYSDWATGNWKERQHALKALWMNHLNKETFFFPFFYCDTIYISCQSMLFVMHSCCAQLMGQREEVLPLCCSSDSLRHWGLSLSVRWMVFELTCYVLDTWETETLVVPFKCHQPCVCLLSGEQYVCMGECWCWCIMVRKHANLLAQYMTASMQSVENTPLTR